MTFAQGIDVWRTLTARPADLANEVPGVAELRGELASILEEAQKTRNTCRRLRTRAPVEAKRLEEATTRGEEAEQQPPAVPPGLLRTDQASNSTVSGSSHGGAGARRNRRSGRRYYRTKSRSRRPAARHPVRIVPG